MTTPRPWRDTATGLSPAGLLPLQAARTITVDFQDPSIYFQLISDGKAFVESLNLSWIVAFLKNTEYSPKRIGIRLILVFL